MKYRVNTERYIEVEAEDEAAAQTMAQAELHENETIVSIEEVPPEEANDEL